MLMARLNMTTRPRREQADNVPQDGVGSHEINSGVDIPLLSCQSV
jgi:hypothetical protein